MSSWRDPILAEFIPGVSRLTLVADPDGLLAEEQLALALRQRGFDLIDFDDPVEFRFAYESRYREAWDRGEQTELSVILRLPTSDLESLPYDLLKAGRQLSFSLGRIFPDLSYPVLEQMDPSLLDAVYQAQQLTATEPMGDNGTRDFILRAVYRIAPDLISNDVELLRALLRIHYARMKMPRDIATRLVTVLSANPDLSKWPLQTIVPDAEAFFAFLQERWPLYLGSLSSAEELKETTFADELEYQGPELLPFDHPDIRVYIDNLFVEARLQPVEAGHLDIEPESWARSGIHVSTAEDESLRAERLFNRLERELPNEEYRYDDWLVIAQRWAELSAMVHAQNQRALQSRLHRLGDRINVIFADWLQVHYASLVNLPPARPAMLHHVPRLLARNLEREPGRSVALIVADGLSLDQWITVRNQLRQQDPRLVIRESATFAWIPTLTSVSRQAIFAGKSPMYFPNSISATSSEPKLWQSFWEGSGLSRFDTSYARSLGLGDPLEDLERLINPGRTIAAGFVIDTIDTMMHGMQLGSTGMHSAIDLWCQNRYLSKMIGQLLELGFQVWLTSDHGNIEAIGRGRPSEGAIAESRGERVRTYRAETLRQRVADEFRFAQEWPPIGLPPRYYPLIATQRDAFVREGAAIVGHGGISIEEVIVPLIKFELKAEN